MKAWSGVPLLKGLSAPSTPTYFQFTSTSNCSVFTEPAARSSFTQINQTANMADAQQQRRLIVSSHSGPSRIQACSWATDYLAAQTAPGLRFRVQPGSCQHEAPDPPWSVFTGFGCAVTQHVCLSSPDNLWFEPNSAHLSIGAPANQWLWADAGCLFHSFRQPGEESADLC